MEDRQANLEARVVQLEELLAYQQRLLDQLNAGVTELRDDADRLLSEQAKLKETVGRLVQFYEAAEGAADEKPPHY
ncbi:MAG: SlyX family protein [Planctomycetota bacterium]